jgi:hypothetical protein
MTMSNVETVMNAGKRFYRAEEALPIVHASNSVTTQIQSRQELDGLFRMALVNFLRIMSRCNKSVI